MVAGTVCDLGISMGKDFGTFEDHTIGKAADADDWNRVRKLIRERNRYVFLTGERDFNRPQTRVFHRLYKKDGFRHVTYIEIPGADHYFGVRGEWLAKGIEALDAGL